MTNVRIKNALVDWTAAAQRQSGQPEHLRQKRRASSAAFYGIIETEKFKFFARAQFGVLTLHSKRARFKAMALNLFIDKLTDSN